MVSGWQWIPAHSADDYPCWGRQPPCLKLGSTTGHNFLSYSCFLAHGEDQTTEKTIFRPKINKIEGGKSPQPLDAIS